MIFDVWIINKRKEKKIDIPEEILELAKLRLEARKKRDFKKSDELRQKILDAGYTIKDTKDSYSIEKKS